MLTGNRLRDRRALRCRIDRQRDRVVRDLPDREHCAEDEEQINGTLNGAAFFLFGTNENRVGGIRAFEVGVGVFHRLHLVDGKTLCKGHAISLHEL